MVIFDQKYHNVMTRVNMTFSASVQIFTLDKLYKIFQHKFWLIPFIS